MNNGSNCTAAAADNRGAVPVCAEHLSVGYDGTAVVRDITLDLKLGQALALVGMNGSGKSTLLKTIVGLLAPLSGRLEIMGAAPGRTPQRIAYLSQFHASGFVLPLRAVDIVQMGRFTARGLLGRMRSEDSDIVADAMRRMGIETLAQKPVRSLSGGQQQRVYLAQTLARRADLLVLDEPTASLDAAGKEIYMQMIAGELARGVSVVVATHDINEASSCDLVMLLAHRVIALGAPRETITPEALLETFGIVLMSRGEQGRLAVVSREHEHDE